MDSDDVQDPVEDNPSPPLIPTVRCDSCGGFVSESVTETIGRAYLGKVFPETWCTLCVKSTERVTSSNEDIETEPDY